MLVYQFPGDQVEYLDGKIYNIKDVTDADLLDALSSGWAISPDGAEALTAPKKPAEPAKPDTE